MCGFVPRCWLLCFLVFRCCSFRSWFGLIFKHDTQGPPTVLPSQWLLKTKYQQPSVWMVCVWERERRKNSHPYHARAKHWYCLWEDRGEADLSASVLLLLVSCSDSLKMTRQIRVNAFLNSPSIRAVYRQPWNSGSMVQGAMSSAVMLIDLQTVWTAKHGFAV